MCEIIKRCQQITAPDEQSAAAAKRRWDSIAKPLGSLGLLEEYIVRMAAIQGREEVDISRRTIIVMCADHGVVKRGVAQAKQEVTRICAEEIARGRSSVNVLARCFEAQVLCVDMGMIQKSPLSIILDRRVAPGTKDFTEGPAMTMEEAETCVAAGMDFVCDLTRTGEKLLVCGEMGIGNTTSASALSCVLLDTAPEKVTGRGAGLSDEGLARKIEAIKRGIQVNRPDASKPLELLAKLGGLEIAGMTGVFLGGAQYRVPVIIDGVTSCVAAAIACRIAPRCRDYMFASHMSEEPAGKALLKMLGFSPIIHANMRLGEGTGAAMLLPLLDGALAVYRSAHKFAALPMEAYKPL